MLDLGVLLDGEAANDEMSNPSVAQPLFLDWKTASLEYLNGFHSLKPKFFT